MIRFKQVGQKQGIKVERKGPHNWGSQKKLEKGERGRVALSKGKRGGAGVDTDQIGLGEKKVWTSGKRDSTPTLSPGRGEGVYKKRLEAKLVFGT